MNQTNVVYILDAGNTVLKFAKFEKGEIIDFQKIKVEKIDEYIEKEKLVDFPCFASSVLDNINNASLKQKLPLLKFLDRFSNLPINIGYETPDTLGLDRICNAVASFQLSNQKNCLSIDIGTCVKFDLINKEGLYLGGSISPGIDLRYRSMNDYTKNLPLITEKSKSDLIGKNTKKSMQSGVINGIEAEINQFITRYSLNFENLFVFLTGGDVEYFDIPLKNDTFVDEFLTIKGLYHIYLLNEA